MDQKSQLKVIKVGFHIIRKVNLPAPRIKIKDYYSPNWRLFTKNFESIEERDKWFTKMLERCNIISI